MGMAPAVSNRNMGLTKFSTPEEKRDRLEELSQLWTDDLNVRIRQAEVQLTGKILLQIGSSGPGSFNLGIEHQVTFVHSSFVRHKAIGQRLHRNPIPGQRNV